MTELATVPVGDGDVADVVVARPEVARGTLEEECGRIERVLEHLAGGTDEVGRQQAVLPREGRRVAGVVEERRERRAGVVRHARDEDGVVRHAVGVVAARVALRVDVPEVAVRGEAAAPRAVGDDGSVTTLDRASTTASPIATASRSRYGAMSSVPGLAVESRVRVRAGVRVRHLNQELGLAEAGPLRAPRRGARARRSRYWNQPMSSATSASVGASPSSGANTAAVAVKGRWIALGDLVRRRAPRACVDARRAASRRVLRRRSGSASWGTSRTRCVYFCSWRSFLHRTDTCGACVRETHRRGS